jgi:hypothetical protein
MQRVVDAWSQDGRWVEGSSGISYNIRYCVPVVVSCGCKVYQMNKTATASYKWIVPTDPTQQQHHPFHETWSSKFMCRSLSGHNLLIVGDSLNEALFFFMGVLATQSMARVVKAFETYKYLNVSCSDHGLPPIGLSFVRSDRLRVGGVFIPEASDTATTTATTTKEFRPPSVRDDPWEQLIQRRNISILLLNRGVSELQLWLFLN